MSANMEASVKLEVDVEVGERVLKARPLSLRQVRVMSERIAKLAGPNVNGVEALDTCIAVIHASLSRAQPSLTIEELESELDQFQARAVLGTILRLSGFGGAEPGEAKP